MSAPSLHTVLGQPSWSFESSHVSAHLTKLGGQLGPVNFRVGKKTVTPYAVAPWAEEAVAPGLPAILRALRGDFFCAPFGGNATPWRGEQHPVHGETANANWRLEAFEKSGPRVTLQASLATKVRRGRVDKFISLVAGQTAVYSRHVLSGSRGPMNLGHHAMLKFPAAPGSGAVSTSRFVRGQVFPGAFEQAENFGYQALQPGAHFRSLARVPLLAGGSADLTRYPARKGFEDLVMLTADAKLPFAWTAVAFPGEGHVWFALRDPRVLRHTIFWWSNGGRHYAPWNGRHAAVLGLEEVTSYFHTGLAESVKPNPLSRRGHPTTLTLHPKKPTTVNYIMAVAAIPKGFDRVKEIRAVSGGVELVAESGKRARAAVALDFLGRE
ncbi:MAG: hypothetical protein EXS32_05050 [Opitutus sp.]|nr:hypothetical protein [Opitutus sp.]